MKTKIPKGFQSAYKKAESIAKDSSAVSKIVEEATNKANKHQGFASDMRSDFMALLRMIKASALGTYKVAWPTIVTALAALLYFVNPLDVIPDFIIGAGLLDDASVLAFAMQRIRSDVQIYLDWEKTENSADKG
jgi:uncharacterized membrane protein YkvA (DUF1232 family)